jgi:hypothetical protein
VVRVLKRRGSDLAAPIVLDLLNSPATPAGVRRTNRDVRLLETAP